MQNAAAMAGPYLVMLGIDRGIPPLRRRRRRAAGRRSPWRSSSPRSSSTRPGAGFLTLSGRIGQAVLLDLRQRVYDHFQRLSVGFHERYTSGRMVSRLTSDVDSIAELVDGGIDDLVLAALSVALGGRHPALAGPAAGARSTLLAFPFLLWLSRWFARASAGAYRRTREAVALVIVHFVESLRRHPRGAGVPPGAAQPARSSTRSTTTTGRPACTRSG